VLGEFEVEGLKVIEPSAAPKASPVSGGVKGLSGTRESPYEPAPLECRGLYGGRFLYRLLSAEVVSKGLVAKVGFRADSSGHSGSSEVLSGSGGGTRKTCEDDGVFSSTDVTSSSSIALLISFRDIEREREGDKSSLAELGPAVCGLGAAKGDRAGMAGNGGSAFVGGADSERSVGGGICGAEKGLGAGICIS
jgi:hypothetical protein